ncbi:hypothetical protein [Sporosarcina sp. SAFN-015]|uniref:hypothetical protein n=1 Tax=Sporosarcina sp. SAFN-015 TaxID=3387274 RepID=UPI003F7E0F76
MFYIALLFNPVNLIFEAKENGAMVVRDKMELDDFYLAYLVDPPGIGFGLIQKK